MSADARGFGHQALEALFAHLVAVLQDGAGERIQPAWSSAERSLLEHLRHEESTVLANFLAAQPRDARAVLEEHAYLRRRVSQLRDALPRLTAADVRTFLAELRAHGRHEELVLYRWAERSHRASAERLKW